MSSLKIRREQGPLFLPLGFVKSLSIFKEVGVGRRPRIGCVATFPSPRLYKTFPYAALNAAFIRLPFRRHPYHHSPHHHHLPTGERSVTATVNRALGSARSRRGGTRLDGEAVVRRVSSQVGHTEAKAYN